MLSVLRMTSIAFVLSCVMYLTTASSHTHTRTTGETAGIDFAYFHRLHDDAASNLASQCSVWREKGQSLETLVEQRQQQQEDGEEEVSHLIEGVCVGVGVCRI